MHSRTHAQGAWHRAAPVLRIDLVFRYRQKGSDSFFFAAGGPCAYRIIDEITESFIVSYHPCHIYMICIILLLHTRVTCCPAAAAVYYFMMCVSNPFASGICVLFFYCPSSSLSCCHHSRAGKYSVMIMIARRVFTSLLCNPPACHPPAQQCISQRPPRAQQATWAAVFPIHDSSLPRIQKCPSATRARLRQRLLYSSIPSSPPEYKTAVIFCSRVSDTRRVWLFIVIVVALFALLRKSVICRNTTTCVSCCCCLCCCVLLVAEL